MIGPHISGNYQGISFFCLLISKSITIIPHLWRVLRKVALYIYILYYCFIFCSIKLIRRRTLYGSIPCRFKTPVIRCIEINVYQSINQAFHVCTDMIRRIGHFSRFIEELGPNWMNCEKVVELCRRSWTIHIPESCFPSV